MAVVRAMETERKRKREREREGGRERQKGTDDDASKIDNTDGCKRLPTALTSFFSSFLLSAVCLFLSRFRFPSFPEMDRALLEF